MPKIKGAGFGIDAAEAVNAEVEGGSQTGYAGETPPSGVYHGVLKILQLTKTGPNSKKPGTPMLKIMVELKGNKGAKAKYDGYGAWSNQTVRPDSAQYVNAFLDALVKGDEKKAKAVRTWFWSQDITAETAEGGHIIAIGKLKIMSPDGRIPVMIRGKYVPAGQYDEKLEIARFLIPAEPKSKDEFEEDELDETRSDETMDESDDEFDESSDEAGF